MAIIAGIDEAGYGPLLGPLVVTAACFDVPDDLRDVCLWKQLRRCISPKRTKNDRRLPILDSKKLYTPAEGLKALERSALVMLRCADHPTSTFRGLVSALCPQQIGEMVHYPWYQNFDTSLPVATTDGEVATRANAVRLETAAVGVRLRGVFVEPLLEGQFNRLVAATQNKATTLMGVTFRLVQRILEHAGGQRVRIVIDRQSGRSHYGPALLTAFPDYHLRIIEESGGRSAYGLTPTLSRSNSAAPATTDPHHVIEFLVSGEAVHLPIALASIFSKYLRELFMRGFNSFWCRQSPQVRPTAGYYSDGTRWLRDMEPALLRCGVNRDMLVRRC